MNRIKTNDSSHNILFSRSEESDKSIDFWTKQMHFMFRTKLCVPYHYINCIVVFSEYFFLFLHIFFDWWRPGKEIARLYAKIIPFIFSFLVFFSFSLFILQKQFAAIHKTKFWNFVQLFPQSYFVYKLHYVVIRN